MSGCTPLFAALSFPFSCVASSFDLGQTIQDKQIWPPLKHRNRPSSRPPSQSPSKSQQTPRSGTGYHHGSRRIRLLSTQSLASPSPSLPAASSTTPPLPCVPRICGHPFPTMPLFARNKEPFSCAVWMHGSPATCIVAKLTTQLLLRNPTMHPQSCPRRSVGSARRPKRKQRPIVVLRPLIRNPPVPQLVARTALKRYPTSTTRQSWP